MSSDRLPWGKFVWAHWENDEALALCSMGAQGLWMRLLCIAVKEGGYVLIGGKAPPIEKLARIVRAPPVDVQAWLDELEDGNVFSRTRAGVIYSRRIVRELRAKDEARETGKLGGNPKLIGDYNEPGFLYIMGVRADGAYKLGISKNPANRVKKVRAQYPEDGIQVLDKTPVRDMGRSERDLHAMFADKKSGEWFRLTGVEVGQVREFFRTLEGSSGGPSTGPSKAEEIRGEERRGDSSDPDGSAQSAPSEDDDLDPLADLRAMPIAKGCWRLAVKVLVDQGRLADPKARAFIGKLKAGGLTDDELWQIAEAAFNEQTEDPQPYLVKAAEGVIERRGSGGGFGPSIRSPTEMRQRLWMQDFKTEPRGWRDHERGPQPGKPGCQVSPEIQREFGVEPAGPQPVRAAG